MKILVLAVCLTLLTVLGPAHPPQALYLDELDLSAMRQGWGKPQRNQCVTEKPLDIGGRRFSRGVGTHASSECWIALDGRGEWFTAQVGVDSAAGNARASLEFQVYGDDRLLWRSGTCRLGDAPKECRVNLAGVRNLGLFVGDADDGIEFDHADWAEALIEYAGERPRTTVAPSEEAIVRTPPFPPSPRINGPTITGVRPNSPFLFRIPATGERPITFSATGLPRGLSLSRETGIITGRIALPGAYRVRLEAKNGRGKTNRDLKILVGPKLALTPPMGWNSWYIHYHRVSDAVMRKAADAMIASGMADCGYQYVNIDDCWMIKPGSNIPEIGGDPREPSGRLRPNRRFPDMKGLTDYIHGKGLRAGIYISPGPRTCGGYEGSFGHEAQDARTFADWGFDFLKYDWCSYGEKAGGNTVEHLKKPYQLMWNELLKQGRDIVFNLCQYGMGKVWEWGGDVGHCWRTTGDLGLEGGSLSSGIYKVGLFNADLADFAAPGRWNDPDYLLIGWVGDAQTGGEGRPTTLTPNEQYSHMSMWSLMAAPLIFSGDMTKLDPFTLNVLCNPEIIDVDQDPLGKQAHVIRKTSDNLILAKDLNDGSKAVGLFNLSPVAARIAVNWLELGVKGKLRVRDLWRQKELGVYASTFQELVPRHGVVMIRIRK